MSDSINEQSELVVLGGGPGGYSAAFAAADIGMKVTLVDDGIKPGGVCLHRGCIPSKALLHAAKMINESKEAAEWGLDFSDQKLNIEKLRSKKQSIVDQLSGGIGELCKARGVTLYRGRGTFLDSTTLELTETDGQENKLDFQHAIIATGSSPVHPKMFDINDDRIIDSTGALELNNVPEKLLVIGGGYIGLEMGTVYAALGSKVTVVEMLSGLLPGADRDLVRPLKKRLDKKFEAIYLNTKVVKISSAQTGITVELEGDVAETSQVFDCVLVSVGRHPNSANLGLENTNVELTDQGFINVDGQLRTTDSNISAIGDVVGHPMLAHKATREAKVAVEALAGEPAMFDNIAIPSVIFTDPEIAWCGITETDAEKSGLNVKVTRFPWAASGRAKTLGQTEGLTKLIFDSESGHLRGMGVVGTGAGELIAEGVIAIETGAYARDLAESIHAHPTLSETIMEAAEAFLGHSTHSYCTRL
jgi:dihydrolipoyl dehydrogenase